MKCRRKLREEDSLRGAPDERQVKGTVDQGIVEERAQQSEESIFYS
jgi:hypothetical protein